MGGMTTRCQPSVRGGGLGTRSAIAYCYKSSYCTAQHNASTRKIKTNSVLCNT